LTGKKKASDQIYQEIVVRPHFDRLSKD
jgi:hypothetical protein